MIITMNDTTVRTDAQASQDCSVNGTLAPGSKPTALQKKRTS
jgi:hypothetical protein